jgi:hypothetical protein
VDRVDVVVVGTVQGVSPSVTPSPRPNPGGTLYKVTIAVEEYLKGSGGPTLVLRSGRVTSCDVFADVGDRFLLGLTGEKSGFYTSNSCNAVRITDETQSEVNAFIAQIREVLLLATTTSQPPPTGTVGALPVAGAGQGSGGHSTWAAVAAIGAAALLAGTALVALRRRRAR